MRLARCFASPAGRGGCYEPRMAESRIIAMGGGGFSMEPDNPLLDDHVLAMAGTPRPRVLFLPTASGDAESYIERFFAAFNGRAQASSLSLVRRAADDLDAVVRAADIVYVGGGSTLNLLALWRAHGLDRVLSDAYRRGTILAGLSAGAMCWFTHAGVTDSFGPGLARLADGLGLLPGSFCPHYDSEPLRRPTYSRMVDDGSLLEGFAADDGVALCFANGVLHEVVSSRPHGRAWRVRRGSHDPLAVRYLGA